MLTCSSWTHVTHRTYLLFSLKFTKVSRWAIQTHHSVGVVYVRVILTRDGVTVGPRAVMADGTESIVGFSVDGAIGTVISWQKTKINNIMPWTGNNLIIVITVLKIMDLVSHKMLEYYIFVHKIWYVFLHVV